MSISFYSADVIIIRFHLCGGKGKTEPRAVILISSYLPYVMDILNSSFIGSRGSAIAIRSKIVELTISRSVFKFIANASACGAVCVVPYDWKLPFYSEVKIRDSVFGGNLVNAFLLDGIQIENYIKSTVCIENSVFSNNTSIRGAKIDVVNIYSTSIFLSNSTFDSNRAVTDDGRAIDFHVINNDRIIINDCTFKNNRAAGDGGAIRIYIGRQSRLDIINSIFLANTCGRAGGGISFDLPNRESIQCLRLKNVTFEGNSAQSGGGISVITEYSQLMKLENVTFRRNFAANGGAISIEKKSLDIYGHSVFTNNAANSSGGALAAYESKIFFKVVLCSFENNSAGRQGGAIFLSKSFLKLMRRAN